MEKDEIGEVMETVELSAAEKKVLEDELDEVNESMGRYQDKAFMMMLELIGIIGIPAALAVILKKTVFIDSGAATTVILLFAALAISFTVIFRKAAKLSEATSKLSRRRKVIRRKLGLKAPKPKIYPDELEKEQENS